MVNPMNEIINVILRTILVLIIIFFLFKLMGKKQVSQMNMFDYITGITIGSIVADISLDIEKNLIAGLICLVIYCMTSVIISYLSLKNLKLRSFFDGTATVLIENGNINRENLRKNKININILETEARLMGYFNLDEINNAILEPNGKISFEPKEKEKENPSAPLDKQDEKAHNVSKSKDTAGTKRGPGRPRKKGGSPKKTPGTEKGDQNEN